MPDFAVAVGDLWREEPRCATAPPPKKPLTGAGALGNGSLDRGGGGRGGGAGAPSEEVRHWCNDSRLPATSPLVSDLIVLKLWVAVETRRNLPIIILDHCAGYFRLGFILLSQAQMRFEIGGFRPHP